MFFSPQKKIIIIFRNLTIVLTTLIIVTLLINYYRVVIILTPQPEAIEKDIIVTLSNEEENEQTNADPLNNKTIQFLFEETIEQNKEFSVPGSKEIKQPATGTVTLINDYFRDQTLVKTTRLLSAEGILFRLKERVTIPAHQKVQIQIYADQHGEQGNILPTSFIIPGLWEGLQDKIYAISDQPTSGGLVQVGMVKQNNLDKAKQELEDKILQIAQENIPRQDLIKQNLDGLAIRKTIQDFSSSAKADDEVGKFTMKLKMRVLLVAFNRQKVFNLALNNLKKQIPANKTLFDIDQQNWQTSVYYFDLIKQQASLKVYLTGQLIINDKDKILNKENLFGFDKEKTKTYLEQYPEIEQVKIKFYPFFIKKIPEQSKRIIYKILI